MALLSKLWSTLQTANVPNVDWALAKTAYARISTGLRDVIDQGETIRVVLDDGLSEDAND